MARRALPIISVAIHRANFRHEQWQFRYGDRVNVWGSGTVTLLGWTTEPAVMAAAIAGVVALVGAIVNGCMTVWSRCQVAKDLSSSREQLVLDSALRLLMHGEPESVVAGLGYIDKYVAKADADADVLILALATLDAYTQPRTVRSGGRG